MTLTLGNLHYLTKHLQSALRDNAECVEVDPPVTPGEVSVLEFLLMEDTPRSIREIVTHTQLAQSWVSTVVKGLVSRGWAIVAQDAKDKRVTTVVLAEEVKEGAQMVMNQDASQALGQLMQGAKADEQALIEQGLEVLYQVVKRNQE